MLTSINSSCDYDKPNCSDDEQCYKYDGSLPNGDSKSKLFSHSQCEMVSHGHALIAMCQPL